MKITRINPPKYKVGRYSLNEYEVRQLMVEVAEKKKPFGIKVSDSSGTVATIQEDGSLSCPLYRMNEMSSATLMLLKLKRTQA